MTVVIAPVELIDSIILTIKSINGIRAEFDFFSVIPLDAIYECLRIDSGK